MELRDLEDCKKPDYPEKAGTNKGRNCWSKGMAYAADAVGHAVHHTAEAVGCKNYPEAAHAHFYNVGALGKYAYKRTTAGKHWQAQGVSNYKNAGLRNPDNFFNAVRAAGTHIL